MSLCHICEAPAKTTAWHERRRMAPQTKTLFMLYNHSLQTLTRTQHSTLLCICMSFVRMSRTCIQAISAEQLFQATSQVWHVHLHCKDWLTQVLSFVVCLSRHAEHLPHVNRSCFLDTETPCKLTWMLSQHWQGACCAS